MEGSCGDMEGSCGDMEGSCGDTKSEYVTSVEDLEPFTTHVDSEPSTSTYISARIQQLMEGRSHFSSDVEWEIEASKDHWSHAETSEELGTETNVEIFRSLQEEWGGFLFDYCDRLKVGRRVAEGGQAEIYEAHIEYSGGIKVEYILKVFKEGSSLRALQRQWPLGLLQRKGTILYDGTLLQDGRFAFRMQRCWGDLRKLIDKRMIHNRNKRPPFLDEEVDCMIAYIATAMRDLHECGIVHRDLKASNVLLHPFWETQDLRTFDPMVHKFICNVSDFECSIGVSGTGFWRAPEILLALKNPDPIKPHTFTEQSDVFSFGMTCFEILTGCVPCEDKRRGDYDYVINGGRPQLPEPVRPAIKELLGRCWHQDAAERPSFQEIVDYLASQSTEESPFARYLNSKWTYGR